jgi:hypothetical protein
LVSLLSWKSNSNRFHNNRKNRRYNPPFVADKVLEILKNPGEKSKLPPMREIVVPNILPELFAREVHESKNKNPPKVRKLTEDTEKTYKKSTTQYHTVR